MLKTIMFPIKASTFYQWTVLISTMITLNIMSIEVIKNMRALATRKIMPSLFKKTEKMMKQAQKSKRMLTKKMESLAKEIDLRWRTLLS